MPLSVTEPIRATDILQARDLKEGKIFMLIGRNGDKIAIKAEPKVTGASIKNAASTVKAIDPAIKMKPLTPTEVHELKMFTNAGIDYIEHLNSFLANTDKPMRQQEKQTFRSLKTAIDTYGGADANGRSNIAKMAAVNMSTLGVALEVDGKPDNDACWDEARETFAKFAKALSKSGGLEKMGEILAGDAFLGNSDRFNFSAVAGKTAKSRGKHGVKIALSGEEAGKGTRLKLIINLNNVILVKEKKGKASRPSMLDYMDPNSEWMKLSSMQDATEGSTWPMIYLLDKAYRKDIAQYMVDDLEYILKPEKSLFGMYKLGGSKAAGRVEEGIVNGIRKITKALEARQGSLPPLVKEYLAVLQADRTGRIEEALRKSGLL